MTVKSPTVFISSTFYDLSPIRAALCTFIENELGYNYLASEFQSFPIDPEENTLENCRRRVEDADMMILVVGHRYGSIDKNTLKSVTNLEYLAAKAKGIPIYVFILKEVFPLLLMWESNPKTDFSKFVDNPKLFDFIKQIRSDDSVWNFPFETAQEIIRTLKIQFAYQMQKGLHIQTKLREREKALDYLSGKALQIALEKPEGWEGLLFAQCVIDEIESKQDLKLAYDSKIAFGIGEIVEDGNISTWIDSLGGEAIRLINGITTMIENSLNSALSTGNIAYISYSSREIGNAYKAAFDWVRKIRCAHLKDIYKPLANEVSLMLDSLINELEQLGEKLNSTLLSARESKRADEDIKLKFKVTLDVSNMDKIEAELKKLPPIA